MKEYIVNLTCPIKKHIRLLTAMLALILSAHSTWADQIVYNFNGINYGTSESDTYIMSNNGNWKWTSNDDISPNVDNSSSIILNLYSGSGIYLYSTTAYSVCIKSITLNVKVDLPADGGGEEVSNASFEANNQQQTIPVSDDYVDVTLTFTNGWDVYQQPIDFTVNSSTGATATLKSLTVNYEKLNPELQYVAGEKNLEPVTEWSINWTERESLGEESFPRLDYKYRVSDISYSSLNTGVATISDNGTISIASIGTTTISASYSGDETYAPSSTSYTLTVADDRTAPSLSFSESTATATYGQTSFTPPTLNNPNQLSAITYNSDNTDVATVNESTGAVTIVGAGTTVITATFTGNDEYKGTSDSYTLTVNKTDATLSFPEETYSAKMKEDFTEPALTASPAGITVTYSSSNTAAATVDATTGKVTLVAEGTTSITAAFAGNDNYNAAEASYTLNIAKADAVATKLAFAANTATATYGQTDFTPPTLSNPDGVPVTYTSDNTDVATVNESTGAVTIAGAGTTVITATFTGNDKYKGTSDSYTLTVNKADATLSFLEDTYNAQQNTPFTEPTLKMSPEGLEVTYSSSDTNVATVNATSGKILILGVGSTVITATFAGNTNYNAASASYTLIVNRDESLYDLWIGNVQVTKQNQRDILGDESDTQAASAIFDGDHTLVITNLNISEPIVSKIPEGLTIYLIGENIICNAFDTVIYSHCEAPLTITTDGNRPGTLHVASGSTSVIKGFSSLELEYNLRLLDPEDGIYQDHQLVDANGNPILLVSIGTTIKPLVKETTITFNDNEFIAVDDYGRRVDVDLSNTAINDILYTLNSDNEDGYDEEDGSIVLNTPMYDVNTNAAPGTTEFSETFTGLTFIVPAGDGVITVDAQTFDGYLIGIKIGDDAPIIASMPNRESYQQDYICDEPTYVYVYNAGTAQARRPLGKKSTTHVKTYSVSVSPNNVQSTNDVQNIVDDYPTDLGYDAIETVEIVYTTNDYWFNMSGQRIDQPKKAGLYIHNGKKVVVK